MPLLVYGVALQEAADTQVKGVGGAAVRSAIEDGLRFFYSEATPQTKSPEIVTAAQQVHAVISDIFSRGPVLPFRYPTVVANEAEIAELAKTRGDAFREFFERVGSNVQMDIRLTLVNNNEGNPDPINTGQAGAHTGATSGRAYLEARARRQALISAAAETCRQAARSADWRIQQRNENIRCQALISRVEVLSFLERMHTLELPGEVKAAVSGPWPPAGFWEDEPR